MLSQHERRQLNEIERRLAASDPELGRTLSDHPRSGNPRHGNTLVAVVLYLLGAFLVLLGSVTLNVALIGTGILALAVAACLHLGRHLHPPH